MAKQKDVNDTEGVTALIKKMDRPHADIIERIRQIILSADNEIGEQIKWNSPSFFYTGAMKPFNAKEYKRDIVVVNLHKGKILLVFPTGATIADTTGILEGSYTDGRRMVSIADIDDIEKKANDLKKVIKDWLKQVEK